MNYQIDLKDVNTRSELYDLLEQKLPLPDYTGRNLDALYDVLSEITEETSIHFLDRDCREYELERYLRRMKTMFGGLMEENPNIKVTYESDENKDSEEN